jgi:hypothetical protein
MPGYSGTPLVQKLGLKPDHRLLLAGAPPDFVEVLGPLPAGVAVVDGKAQDLDVAVLFAASQAELRARFPKLATRLGPTGILWAAWPKRASGVPTDLAENIVRQIGLATGLVDVKVCAVTDVWSGLGFRNRRRSRPAAAE